MPAIGIGVSPFLGLLPPASAVSYYMRVKAAGGTIQDFSELVGLSLDYERIRNLNPSLYTFASGRKAGTLFSLIPTDGSGDFSVTRSGSTAMELNKDGFWQPVAANVPRFDYINNEPLINVEAQSTNLLTRPRSFAHSDWTKSGARIEGDPSTAGAELRLSALVNGNMTTFAAVGVNGFDATSNGAATHRCGSADEIVLVENGLYKIEFDQTLNSGTQPSVGLADSIGGTARSATQAAVAGHNLFYLLATASTTGVVQFVNSSTATDYAIRNFTIKKVTGFACPFVDANGVNTNEGYNLVATANNGYIRLATPLTITNAAQYTNSIWIKRISGTGDVYIIDTNTADRVKVITGEWVRYDYTATSSSTSGQIGVKLATAGDVVRICVAQPEAGEVASSFIYGAEGSTQTRNADVIVKTGAQDLIGQTEGWVLFESDGSDIEVFGLVAKGVSKGLFNYNGTDIELYADGELADSATGAYDWSGMDSVVLGSYADNYLNGRLKIMVLGKTKLTAAVAASLT